jgi:hypothetical protein
MSDSSRTQRLDAEPPDLSRQPPGLPPWLAARLLQGGEETAWVYGPKAQPSLERYLTHPALFLVALGLGVLGVGGGWLLNHPRFPTLPLSCLVAGFLVLASIFVLGIFSGYFTRLVVSNRRIILSQGREVCRSWDIDKLPPSLLRYRMVGGEATSRTVDVDALTSMLGGASDKFVDAKTILTFGKHLDRIQARDKDQR